MRSRTVNTEAAGRARSAANPPASKVRSERPAPTWSTTVARFASPISRSRQAATTSSAAPTSVTSFTTPRRSMSKRRARPMRGRPTHCRRLSRVVPDEPVVAAITNPFTRPGWRPPGGARRPAHRVADGGDRAPAQGGECRRGVVGHRLERKGPLGPQPPPVAPVVDGDERRSLGQRTVGPEPVQVGGRGPAVQRAPREGCRAGPRAPGRTSRPGRAGRGCDRAGRTGRADRSWHHRGPWRNPVWCQRPATVRVMPGSARRFRPAIVAQRGGPALRG